MTVMGVVFGWPPRYVGRAAVNFLRQALPANLVASMLCSLWPDPGGLTLLGAMSALCQVSIRFVDFAHGLPVEGRVLRGVPWFCAMPHF